MFKLLPTLVLLSLLVLGLAITGIGLNPIRPIQLNKGLTTKYMFYINPETSISANAKIQVTFPA